MEDELKRPLRILLLEDEPTDAELEESELRNAGLSFISRRVDTREAFVRALEEFSPDIVLSDYKLPAFDGGSAVKIVREAHPDVPVVMVTGAMGDEKAIELLKLGARDYILKDRLSRLAPAVKRTLSEERSTRARKAAEESLRESEARYQAIMQTANDAIVCMRPDGVIHLWNHKAEEMFGYTAREAIGLKVHELITPMQYRGQEIEGLRQFARTGSGPIVGKTLDLTALHKNGTEFPIELSISSMNIRGEWHATGIIRDTTERKQAENTLRLHSEMLNNLSEGIFLIRASDGLIVFTNPQFDRMFGYEPDELLGQNVSVVNAPGKESPQAVADAIISELAQTGKWSGEIQNIRKDGTTFWCYASTSAFDHPRYGKVWVSVHEDITERKKAEVRIQKLTQLYATLSQTNTTIVRAASREELFARICENAVEYGKFVMAWVGLVDKAAHGVRPVCHYGAEQGYLENIFISIDDMPEGRGPTGTAIRENRVHFINNFTTDERALPWREAALKRGFQSSAGLPLRLEGKVIGALTMYAGEPDFFDAEQLNLLEEMAADISFALDGFEREALRRKAEEERGTALHKLRKALEDSVRVAASISEVRDPYTAGHQQRVSQLAVAIAREMGLPATQIDGIHFGGLIHDIGKIGVPAEILSKPSILTPLEMKLIQTHPQAGYEVVRDIEFPWPVAQMILQHHERLDGSGYPAGLKGDEIILEARIIAVADTVEAMWSHRPYRPGLGIEAALKEIAATSGTRYDKQAVDICLRLIREKGFTFDTD